MPRARSSRRAGSSRPARSSRRTPSSTGGHGDGALFDLATQVGAHLTARALRLVTAESCTGGWVAKALTDVPGCSAIFSEGYVSYGNIAKHRDLGVSAETLRRHGAVSRQVVQQMARGALDRTGADVAVAVSGIAGPDGGTPAKPVGTVWFCWVERGRRMERIRTALRRLNGGREAIRRKSVALALQGILPAPLSRMRRKAQPEPVAARQRAKRKRAAGKRGTGRSRGAGGRKRG